MLKCGCRVLFFRENGILRGQVRLNGVVIGELPDVPQYLMGITGTLYNYIALLARGQGLMAIRTDIVAEFEIVPPLTDERRTADAA